MADPVLIVQNTVFFVSIYIVLALSLNIVIGYAGVISLAHAAFLGIGAYSMALIAVALTPDGSDSLSPIAFTLCIACSVLIPATLAIVAGSLLLRLHGDYFVMVSLGFGEMVRSVLSASDWSGGNLGVRNIPHFELLGLNLNTGWPAALIAVLLAIVTYVFCGRIEQSRFGLSMRAVRDDEIVAKTSGYWPPLVRLNAFVLSAAFAGLAGALLAQYYTYIDPSFFSLNEMILILVMISVGGAGSRLSSAAGAAIIILITFGTSFISLPPDQVGPVRQIIYAIALISIVRFRPQGLFGHGAETIR